MAAQGNDERAIRRLIRRATSRHNWSLVEALFNELGVLLEETVEAQPTG